MHFSPGCRCFYFVSLPFIFNFLFGFAIFVLSLLQFYTLAIYYRFFVQDKKALDRLTEEAASEAVRKKSPLGNLSSVNAVEETRRSDTSGRDCLLEIEGISEK